MRSIIMVKAKRFKIENYKDKIDEVVLLFTSYLDNYPVKTSKSKHGLMGPVAKILERVKAGKRDAKALAGYALHVHEMNQKNRGFINNVALNALEKGTEILVQICREIPVTAVDKVIEQIDYRIYYEQRKKILLYFEHIKLDFIKFLKDKYKITDEFIKIWGAKKLLPIEQIKFPSTKSENYRSNEAYKQDVDEFWASRKSEPIVCEED